MRRKVGRREGEEKVREVGDEREVGRREGEDRWRGNGKRK